MCVFAEKRISVGISGGLAPYTLPLNNSNAFNGAFINNGNDAHIYTSLNILYTFLEKYQVGLQTASTEINYKINTHKAIFKQLNITNSTHFSFDPYYVANPAIPITIVFNRILNFTSLSCYTGAEAGYERYVLLRGDGGAFSGVVGRYSFWGYVPPFKCGEAQRKYCH